ncbi:MAG: hypothetical protein AAFQ87_09870 [Bacteroidota bacterium]
MNYLRSQGLRHAIWLVALLSQLWQTDHYFTYSGPDRNLQMLAAKQALLHDDWCIPLQTETGSQCEALTGWPPAFGFLIQRFYQLSGDWFLAVRWFNGLGVLLVFCLMHLLLGALRTDLHPWVYPSLFAFWGISFTPFYYTFGIEEWALATFLLASIAGLRLWQADRWHWGWWLTLAAALALGFSMRYAYAPLGVLLLIPLLMGRYKAPAWRLQAAWSSIGLILLALGSFVFLQPTTSGGMRWYQLLRGADLYWTNLLHFDAFPLKAWAYFSLDSLLRKTSISNPSLEGFAKAMMFLLSFRMISLLWRQFRHLPAQSAFRYLQTGWWSISLLTIIFLTVLSIFLPPELHDNQWYWTFVMETRYYAPLLVVIQLLGLQWVFERSPKEGKRWLSWATKALLILIFAYNIGHSLYRLSDERGTRWSASEQEMLAVYEEVAAIVNTDQEVWWQEGSTIREQDQANLAALAGARIIPFALLGEISPSPNDKIVLLPKAP